MDGPMHVMRSSSVSDVADFESAVRMSRTLPAGANSDINSHPEDYVVLDGKPVRLKKPSSAYSIEKTDLQGIASPQEFVVLGRDKSLRNRSTMGEQENVNVNRSDLTSSKDLSRQARRIRELESFVPDGVADSDAKTTVNSSNESGDETLESLRRASYLKRPSSSQKSNNSKLTAAPSLEASAVNETVEASDTTQLLDVGIIDSLSETEGTGKRKKRGPPPSLAQRLALGSTERRKLNYAAAGTTAGAAHADSPVSRISESEKTPSFRTDPVLDSLRSATIGEDLNHTNSAHAVSIVRKLKSDRALNSAVSPSPTGHIENIFSPSNTLTLNTTLTTTTTPLPHQTPLELSLPTPTPIQSYKTTFFWKDQKAQLAAQGKSDIFLFIAHDNPQMGKSVATQLVDSGMYSTAGGSSSTKYNNNTASNSSNTGAGMMCMLECKDQAKPPNVHFIIGKIVYSGDYHHIEGFESTQSRGSGCIVVCELRAIKCDIKALTTRNRNDIIEVDLVNLPERAGVPLTSEQDLRTFLRPCTERVDVILDPIQSHNQWYPYWEGLRRMAPQFRSKGIGYLRLGDDMSQYGSAFLSLDAGVTYLDDGATSIVNTSSTPGLASGFNSALGTPYTYGNKAKGSGLRLSRSFSGTAGAGLPGSLNNTFGSGKFNYTYTPSSTTANPTAVTPAPDSVSSGNHVSGADSAISGTNSGIPRSPRAAPALNSTSKKLSFTSGSAKNSAIVTNGADGSSPRAGVQVTVGLKRSNSNHQNAATDPQWDESLSHLRECLHTLKSNDTMKWTERIEILQRLSYIMQSIAAFTTIESFVFTHYSILCEVFTLLTETIAKHTNPNVLVCTASVVCTIEYGALLISSGCWLPWRGLILECVHTLRSTNKMMHEAMSACLTHLYTHSSITMATLCNGSLLTDIILGTKAGAAKKGSTANGKVATAANTVKVIQWLDTVCNIDVDTLLTCYAISSSDTTTPNNTIIPTAEVHGMVKTLLVLLSHREETTREQTIMLLTTLFTWDVLGTLFQTGLNGLLLLSRKLSAEGVRKTANSGEDADAKLRLFEDSLTPALTTLLGEIKTLSARSYDKIVSLLAQRVCKQALSCAVSSVSKVVETPTVVSPRALKRADSGSIVNVTTTTTTTNTTNVTMKLASSPPEIISSPSMNRSGSSSPHTLTALATTALISPRLSFSRVGSASSTGSSERSRNTTQLNPAMNNSNSDHNLRIASNASTPPQNYTLKDVTSSSMTNQHTNSALIGHLTPILTPRDNAIVNNLSSGVISLSNKDATIDKAKMQIGLQGIKSMRKGSFNNNNSRCSTANSATSPRGTDNTLGTTTETDAVTTTSRTSSASRLRRRVIQTANPDSSETSPVKTNITTLNPLNTEVANRSRASSGEMSPSSFKSTLTAPVSGTTPHHTGGVDIITPRGEHCAPMRSPVMRINKSMHPAIAASSSPPQIEVDIKATLSNLDPLWYEAKLLLKQVPTTETAWESLSQVIRKSHTFFASLNALSAHTGVPKGAILRHVLPFDENTSSNDQSKGRVSPRGNSAGSGNTAATPAALIGHEENLQILAHRAIELRGIIRVKMADEADVNQAATATSLLRKFIEQLDYASFTHNLAALQIINRLESL